MTSLAGFMDPPHPVTRPAMSKGSPGYFRTSDLKTSRSASSLSSLFAAPSLSAGGTHIAVHVSDDTDELAREKGFANFQQMLRPFGEDLQGRLTVRDSVGCSNSYDDFGVRFVRLTEVSTSGEHWETWASGPGKDATPSAGEDLFVGGNIDEVEELVELYLDQNNDHFLTHPFTTDVTGAGSLPPLSDQFFYLHYLRRLLSAIPVSPHETFSHPVACIIAISSRNTSPIETLRNLYASGNQMSLPKYVSADYLRYYVLVHDEDEDDIGKSNALFDQMKKHFGLSCHLLRLRSGGKTANTDDDAITVPTCQWRSAAEELASIHKKDTEENQLLCLPETDVSAMSTLVREMTQMSVVPFMERCIATWNDQVASRRRGISGRFLSISKRYFGTSSSRHSTSSSNYDPISASYPPSSPEAQMRKLADFAFMLRDWKLAHSVYDLLRTDFNSDKAWKYHAAAHEMTAISLVLTGRPQSNKLRQETIEPMIDLACYSYVARCSATYSALRCLLVVAELLRLCGGAAVDEAAKLAIRARETQALGRIGHALITERVGDCYSVRQGMGSQALGSRQRKAAMWKILAANEWMLAGKAVRATRCLCDALPLYHASKFDRIGKLTKALQCQTGNTYLFKEGYMVEDAGDSDESEVERLKLGRIRKSVITPIQGRQGDEFVES